MSPNKKIISDDDKEDFLKIINKNGFFLEERVWKILSSEIDGLFGIRRNDAINHEDKRTEFDTIFENDNYVAVIECKKTDYRWIFPTDKDRNNVITIVYWKDSEYPKAISRTVNFQTAYTGIGILFDQNERLSNKNNKESFNTSKSLYEGIIQVLKQTEALLCRGESLASPRTPLRSIFPIIVTNAKLYTLPFKTNSMTPTGDLKTFDDLEEVGYVGYNIAYPLKYSSTGGAEYIEDSSKNFYHWKTVFIVNVNHLKEILNVLNSIRPN